jgi:hypothetical protein
VPRKALVVLGVTLVVAAASSESGDELSAVHPDKCDATAKTAAHSPATSREGDI